MAVPNNEYDLEQDKINESIAESIGLLSSQIPEDGKQTIINDAIASDESVSVESFQVSALALKILQAKQEEEAYQQEMDALFKRLADKSGIDLEEGAENSPERFESAENGVNSFTTNDVEKYAPQTYQDIQSEFTDIDEVRDRMTAAGIEAPNKQDFTALAKKIQLSESFHRSFGDQKIDYYEKLSQSAPEINAAFSSENLKKGRKLATLFAMTAATGGTNLLMKGGLFAAKEIFTNEKVQEITKKAGQGFRSFIEKKGVNLGPYDTAKSYLKDKADKFKESKHGGKLLIGAGVLGVVAWQVYSGNLDAESLKGAYDNVQEFLHEPFSIGDVALEVKEGDSVYSKVEAMLTEQLGEVPDANKVMAITSDLVEQNAISNPELLTEGYALSFDYENYQDVTTATQEQVDRAIGGYEFANSQGYENILEVKEGDSVYSTVEAMLTEQLGEVPDANKVMAITSDLVEQHAISSPELLTEGHALSFDYENYKDVTTATQEQVDRAIGGYEFANSQGYENSGTTTRVTGPAQDWFDAAEMSEHDRNMADTPPPPAVDPSQANQPAQTAQPASHAESMKDTPNENTRVLQDNDANGDVPLPEIHMETVTVPEGGSIYRSIETQLTEKLGMNPSPQQVTAIASDFITENGITNPEMIKEGLEISFDYKDYEHVSSVTQLQMDNVIYGSDLMKDVATPRPSLMELKEPLEKAPQGFETNKPEVTKNFETRSPKEWMDHKDRFGL